MARISKEARVQVRLRLLASAAQHFAEHGFKGANINQISVDAGFAKGTVYNYFSSKEELFSAILAVGTEETVRRYRARDLPDNLRDHLQAIVEEDVALVLEQEAMAKVFVRELLSSSPTTRELVHAGIAPLVVLVVELLEGSQSRGELRQDRSATELSTAFLGMITMAYVQNWSSDGRRPTWEELPAFVVSMFLDGALA